MKRLNSRRVSSDNRAHGLGTAVRESRRSGRHSVLGVVVHHGSSGFQLVGGRAGRRHRGHLCRDCRPAGKPGTKAATRPPSQVICGPSRRHRSLCDRAWWGVSTNAKIKDQLIRYTDFNGETRPNKDASHFLGPYLRSVPPLPVGLKKGGTKIDEESKAGSGMSAGSTMKQRAPSAPTVPNRVGQSGHPVQLLLNPRRESAEGKPTCDRFAGQNDGKIV